jgi:hypothetical protein
MHDDHRSMQLRVFVCGSRGDVSFDRDGGVGLTGGWAARWKGRNGRGVRGYVTFGGDG